MAKNCVNRRCVLLNLVYNLVLNNVLGGIGTLFQGNILEVSWGLIMVGLGVLLLVGVRKGDRSLLLTFLILEPFLLAYGTVKGIGEIVEGLVVPNSNVHLFSILAIVGNVICWLLLFSVYIIYRDINSIKKEEMKDENESKEACENEAKSVAV